MPVVKAEIEHLSRILEISNQVNINVDSKVKNTEEDFKMYIDAGNINVCIDNTYLERVLGFILYFDHTVYGYIELICVDKECRGQGIGKALVESIQKDDWVCVEVCCMIEDERTNEFFQKQGFKLSNQRTDWYIKE